MAQHIDVYAPARARAPVPLPRLSKRGPGMRRGVGNAAGTDVLLHAVLETAEVVG